MNQISVDALNFEVTVLAFHMNMNYYTQSGEPIRNPTARVVYEHLPHVFIAAKSIQTVFAGA